MLDNDSGPFVRVECNRGRMKTGSRSRLAGEREVAIDLCVKSYQEQEEGDLAVSKKEVIKRLEGLYERSLKNERLTDPNKKRSLRSKILMQGLVEDLLEAAEWPTIDCQQSSSSQPKPGGIM